MFVAIIHNVFVIYLVKTRNIYKCILEIMYIKYEVMKKKVAKHLLGLLGFMAYQPL